jgi:DNA repair exonuclease SbcCD ATPase subunit
MIKFTEVSWSNCFSYGESNKIRLDENILTQLVGKNGNGKSSIALIIEECLFNTNSKKIKKADILNRYVKSKNYSIEVRFEKDGVPFTVNTVRTISTSTVKLFRNEEDISLKTATGTYKQIEYILGFDHKTFSQIVYQSSVSSLEFLTATDSTRKKFLIDLLNLGKYTKALDVFKELASGMSKQVDTISAKIETINNWLTKYSKTDLTIKELEEEIPEPVGMREQVVLLNKELTNISTTNKKISQNNTYKTVLASINIDSPYTKPDHPLLKEWVLRVGSIQQELKDGLALSKKPSTKIIKCPTCSQDMDNLVMFTRVTNFISKKPILQAELDKLESNIKDAERANKVYQEYDKKVQEWEKYHMLIDPSMPSELLDKDVLDKEIASYTASIKVSESAIAATRLRNKTITEHNSKAKVVSEQLVEMTAERLVLSEELKLRVAELSNLQILVKTFSNTGLVALKIECMVKDLEALTNEYLAVMSDGRFQLSFVVVSDKLNVVITDNSKDIDIAALSSGERARVLISTLLAIRKLMQSISNSRTNLLILDETIEVLDSEGKERLVEVLLNEESLNVLLISHSFSHPLIEKLEVLKENNISKLE